MSDESEEKTYPTTIDSAIELILLKMPDEMKAWMIKIDDESKVFLELCKRMSGMWVRALLGLWGENRELLSQFNNRHADGISTALLIECWKRLRAERKPKPRSRRPRRE